MIAENYLEKNELHVERLGRGFAWMDTGTPEPFLQAANFIKTIEQRQGLKIACPEEIAFHLRWIDDRQLFALGKALNQSDYGAYLLRLARGARG